MVTIHSATTATMNNWIPELNQQSPKYLALSDAIEQAISDGDLLPGEKLPTHRALADRLGVTVGTVTRGYAEAERRRLLESRVGSGTYVKDQLNPPASFYQSPSDQGLLNLGYSLPIELDQGDRLAETLQQLSREPKLLSVLLDYQTNDAMPHHRLAGKQWLSECGFEQIDAERLIITSGGQHGINLCLQALTGHGDTVLAEGLTFPGFIAACQQHKLKLVGVDHDDQGMTPDALRLACQRYRPKLVYLMTRLGNPLPTTMSAQRIDQLADVCRQYQCLVLEDDVQGAMGDADTPSFSNRHPEITVLTTSLSKVITGGLRVGYLHAPQQWIPALSQALRVSQWMVAPLNIEIASHWIESSQIQQCLADQKRVLKQRHQLVKQTLSGFSLINNPNSLNVWLNLPQPWRANAFVQHCQQAGLLVKSAEVFAAGHYAAPQAIRFSLGGRLTDQQLEQVLQTLNNILNNERPSTEFTT